MINESQQEKPISCYLEIKLKYAVCQNVNEQQQQRYQRTTIIFWVKYKNLTWIYMTMDAQHSHKHADSHSQTHRGTNTNAQHIDENTQKITVLTPSQQPLRNILMYVLHT